MTPYYQDILTRVMAVLQESSAPPAVVVRIVVGELPEIPEREVRELIWSLVGKGAVVLDAYGLLRLTERGAKSA